MNKKDKMRLEGPLSAAETRWAMELADKLPDEVDLSFMEVKMLTRMPVECWPKDLLAKVRLVIDVEDLMDGSSTT